MMTAILENLLTEKARSLPLSRALYGRSTIPAGVDEMLRIAREHGVREVARCLVTCADITFEDPNLASRILVNAVSGPVQQTVVPDPSPVGFDELLRQLKMLSVGYLSAIGRP